MAGTPERRASFSPATAPTIATSTASGQDRVGSSRRHWGRAPAATGWWPSTLCRCRRAAMTRTTTMRRGAGPATRGLRPQDVLWASILDTMNGTGTAMGGTQGSRVSYPHATTMTTATSTARPLESGASSRPVTASRARTAAPAQRRCTHWGRAATTSTTETSTTGPLGSRASCLRCSIALGRPRWKWRSCCRRATMSTTATPTTANRRSWASARRCPRI
mmetsp:Transcript_37936/g.62933  ORF Transcript_37936/g.62933 Transcript_37936/m.62933 type:complete len:220 (+) Transcript_37936:1463-2122(+)